MKTYLLSIQQPCTEDWDKMTQGKNGKHCEACCKTVVDFSGMTEKDILDYLLKHPNSCGRISRHHLNKPVNHYPVKSVRLRPWATVAAMLIAGLFSVQQIQSQTTDPLQRHQLTDKDFKEYIPVKTSASEENDNVRTNEVTQKAAIDSMITIKGTIRMGKSDGSLALGALVWLQFDEISGTGTTAKDGKFEFQVKNSEVLKSAYLLVSPTDENFEAKVSLTNQAVVNSTIEVDIILEEKQEYYTMGAVLVTRIVGCDFSRINFPEQFMEGQRIERKNIMKHPGF